MPSAAGKRVGRVLAGCSKPEAEDKPGLSYLASDTDSDTDTIPYAPKQESDRIRESEKP